MKFIVTFLLFVFSTKLLATAGQERDKNQSKNTTEVYNQSETTIPITKDTQPEITNPVTEDDQMKNLYNDEEVEWGKDGNPPYEDESPNTDSDEFALFISSDENDPETEQTAQTDDSENEITKFDLPSSKTAPPADTEPTKKAQTSESKHEITEIDHPSSKTTAPAKTKPKTSKGWKKYIAVRELEESSQRQQPFMLVKTKEYYNMKTYEISHSILAMRLHKFYKKKYTSNQIFGVKLASRMASLRPKFTDEQIKDEFRFETLSELQKKLFDKDIYDYKFFTKGIGSLYATCPKKLPQEVQLKDVDRRETNSIVYSANHNQQNQTSTSGHAESKPSLSPNPQNSELLDETTKPQSPPQSSNSLEKKTIIQKMQVLEPVDNTIILHYYWPSLHLCDFELEPTFILDELIDYDLYSVGYMVEFKKPPNKPEVNNIFHVPENMKWYHITFYALDIKTKDTLFVFYAMPFYTVVRDDIKNLITYENYKKNENVYPDDMDFDYLYSQNNQLNVFRDLFGDDYEKYHNDDDLMLIKQELLDQTTLPVMAHRMVALYYMNIAPMYKCVKDAWSKVEQVVKNIELPRTDGDLIFKVVSGTYGELKIKGESIFLYKPKDPKQRRLRVPLAFYKMVHITFTPLQVLRLPNRTNYFTIVIIVMNNPFEEIHESICDEEIKCEDHGWDVTEQNTQNRITSCCKFTDNLAQKLGIKDIKTTSQSNRLLSIDNLRAIIRNDKPYTPEFGDNFLPDELKKENTVTVSNS